MTLRERVLLIGAAGLVGAHVARALDQEDLVVTHHVTPVPGGMGLDVTDEAASRHLMQELRPSVVILAAAEPHVERCEREPTETRRVNVDAARPIAEEARALGALVVVLSSEYVFEGTSGAYEEDDPVHPLNEYGRQKVEVEGIVREVPRHLICRTSGVFGWEPARKNFVCQVIDHLRAGRDFIVPADQVITPTYAPDLASAVVTLIRRGATGTVHTVGPEIIRRVRFAELICAVFGLESSRIVPRPTDELGHAAPRPKLAGLRDKRLREALGRPLRPLDRALYEMLESEPGRARSAPI